MRRVDYSSECGTSRLCEGCRGYGVQEDAPLASFHWATQQVCFLPIKTPFILGSSAARTAYCCRIGQSLGLLFPAFPPVEQHVSDPEALRRVPREEPVGDWPRRAEPATAAVPGARDAPPPTVSACRSAADPHTQRQAACAARNMFVHLNQCLFFLPALATPLRQNGPLPSPQCTVGPVLQSLLHVPRLTPLYTSHPFA